MKMSILYFEYKNIRKINNLKISFEKNERVVKNTFLMMGNGTGKTTTMTLIKGLLDGTAVSWKPEKVKGFAPLHGKCTNGSFAIAVKFDDIQYIYSIELDYSIGKVVIKTSTISKGKGGIENGRILPNSLRDIFSSEFVRRFVFDGEQAMKSLDSSSNEAEETIKYLYRLDELDEILTINNRFLLDVQNAEGKKGTEGSIGVLKGRKKSAESNLQRLKKERDTLKKEIDRVNHGLTVKTGQRVKINQKSDELNNKKIEIEKQQKENRGEIDVKIEEIINILKTPSRVSARICDSMNELGCNMKKLKLPKSISKDFFKELAETQTCICGRCIGQEEKIEILKNAEKYLGSDQQSVLNTVKSSLMSGEFDNTLKNTFEELISLKKEELLLSQRHSVNEEALLKAGGDRAKSLQAEIDKLNAEKGGYESKIRIIESKDESDETLNSNNNIYRAEQEIQYYENSIASATRTKDALKKKNIVEDLINKIKTQATTVLKEEILRKTNEKLKEAITDDIIEVESIDNYIKLKGKSGASEGQTLSIAYCFLGTLFEDSELEFPFIIDSPAGKMDLDKRQAIAEIIPSVFNQLIAFVTSAEVEKFADQFYGDVDTQYITIIASTDNSTVVVHEGKEFFDSYQRENQEEGEE